MLPILALLQLLKLFKSKDGRFKIGGKCAEPMDLLEGRDPNDATDPSVGEGDRKGATGTSASFVGFAYATLALHRWDLSLPTSP